MGKGRQALVGYRKVGSVRYGLYESVYHSVNGDLLLLTMKHPTDAGYAEVLLGLPAALAAYVSERSGGDPYVQEHMLAAAGDGPMAYLDFIRVRESSRGRGVGDRLLDATLTELEERGARLMYAYSAPDSDQDPDRLLGWYERHGFVRLDEPTSMNETVPIVRRA